MTFVPRPLIESRPKGLYQIIYVSTAIGPIDDRALDEITAKSRRNNERDGITGVLMYNDGMFFQVLEGTEEAVCACFDRIGQDRHHHGISLIWHADLAARTFAKWQLGFFRVGDLRGDSCREKRLLQDLLKDREFLLRSDSIGCFFATWMLDHVRSQR